jgi:hypothetical protein
VKIFPEKEVPMKKHTMTTVNDLLLIYMEDNPLSFARVEDIEPDVKPGWYRIKLLVLQIPPTVVTWILRDSYIDGREYTMGGKRMRLEKIVVPETTLTAVESSPQKPGPEKSDVVKNDRPKESKVISFADMKKDRKS